LNSIQKAGEIGRSAGYSYEDIILNKIQNNVNGQIAQKIIKTIVEKESLNLYNYKIFVEKMPKSVQDRFEDRKTSPKADIKIIFHNSQNIYVFGISLKSSSANIQVQITNVKNFKQICINKGLFFSDKLEIALSKFSGFGEHKPQEEIKDKLKQGQRDRLLITELNDNEQKEIEEFFNINQKVITEIVLKEGSALKEYFADYYLVNNSEFSKTNTVDFCIKHIDEVIQDSIQKSNYQVTKNGSFHIGSITVQMKGSGEGEAYHGLQFKKKGC